VLADEDFLAGDWRLAVAHAQGFEGTRTLQRTSQTFGFSDFDRDFGSQVFDQAFHLPFLYSVSARSSFAIKLPLNLRFSCFQSILVLDYKDVIFFWSIKLCVYVCFGTHRYLPPEIGCLKKLEYLDLSFNKMKTLPAEISYLKGLISMKVANNKLVELPAAMSSLSRLERLDLSNNRLTSLGSLELASMHRLQELNLQVLS